MSQGKLVVSFRTRNSSVPMRFLTDLQNPWRCHYTTFWDRAEVKSATRRSNTFSYLGRGSLLSERKQASELDRLEFILCVLWYLTSVNLAFFSFIKMKYRMLWRETNKNNKLKNKKEIWNVAKKKKEREKECCDLKMSSGSTNP